MSLFSAKRLLILIFLASFLCSCSTSPTKSPTPLKITFNAPPATFDPRKSGDFISSTLICMIYDGLTRCLTEGGVELAIAERVDISSDGLIYTFHLRKAFWSDGHPVTAEDFERSWKQVLTPSFHALCSYLLFSIKNAERYTKGEVSAEDVGIHALDAQTLQVELLHPTPYFLSLTSFPLFFPVPSHVELFTETICNGPFKIEKNQSNSEIFLKKNPLFWNAKTTSLEAIQIQIIPDENTALQMFERGELDWLGAPLAPISLDSIHMMRDRLRFIPMAASTFITFNMEIFPFNHLKIRQAFAFSLDREQLIEQIALAGQIPAERCLPPSLFDMSFNLQKITTAGSKRQPLFGKADTEKARRLFEEALLELKASRTDFETITLYYKPTQMEKRLAQVLQRQWHDALGITLRIEQIEQKTHLERLHQRNYQIALAIWIAQFHDPVNILERFRLPSNPKNYAGWSHEQYAYLLDQATMTRDAARRLDLLTQAEEIFACDLPVFPLYHWASPCLIHPRIKTAAITPTGNVLFERFEID